MPESGHANNVEDWQNLIAACTGFGADHKPSNVSIQLGSMTTLHTEVEGLMDGVRTNIVRCKNKDADRSNIDTGLRPRMPQLLGVLRARGREGKKGNQWMFSDEKPEIQF